MGFVGALHSLRSFRRRLPRALGLNEAPKCHKANNTMPLHPKQIRPYSDSDIRQSRYLDDYQKQLLLKQDNPIKGNQRDWKETLSTAIADINEWEAILNPRPFSSDPFRIQDGALIKRASGHPPLDSGRSVTAFTSWVHDLYAKQTSTESIDSGRRADRELATERLLPKSSARWKLIHNGMGGNQDKFYTIPNLSICGHPMTASPDLVFKESHTGRILIIEIKTTELPIPTNGWPDVRAQLWCYAQIPEFRSAREIILRAAFYGIKPSLFRRCAIGWSYGDNSFDSLSERLFFYYKFQRERK
jgi:hypothetical protein